MTAKLPAHPYVPDGAKDPRALKPIERCLTCGLPQTHASHTLPATAAEVVEAEARRLGETELETP